MKFIKEFLIFISLAIFFSCSSKPEQDELLNDSPPIVEEQDSTVGSNEDINLILKQYDNPIRDFWQNPELVVEKLGNISGKVVADIGAGTGYFTFRMAPLASKVIAIDVENRFLEYIEDRKFELGESGFTNKIETRLCLPDDPLIANEEVNVVLIVNTFHFIRDRIPYLKKIYSGMQPGGELVLVDFKKGKMSVGPMESAKVALSTAVKELRAAGFTIEEEDTTGLQFQYIIKALK
jgi:SAM-dependent methyltransferase